MLSRELKALTETGLIDRKDFGVVPPKVEYRLTRKGQSFDPGHSAIRTWGTRHFIDATSHTVEMLRPIIDIAGRRHRQNPRPERLKRACHIAPVRNGLVIRSWPMLEPGPWPQMKPTSSPSGNSLSVIDLISVA